MYSYNNTKEFIQDYKKGKIGFPYKRLRYTDAEILKMFNNLKKEKTDDLVINKFYTIHNLIMKPLSNARDLLFLGKPSLLIVKIEYLKKFEMLSDMFNEDNRIRCKFFSSNEDPMSYFHNNIQKLADDTLYEYKIINMKNLYEVFYKNVKMCSSFKPILLKYFIDKYNCKSVLDPCSGWGDRLIAAMACDVRYVGVDPNYLLHPKYKEMIEFFKKSTKKYTMIEGKIQDVKLPDEKFDLVFTSPPYFTIEKYNNSTESTSEEEWFKTFLIPLINKTYNKLNYGGHMILIINQLRNDKYIYDMLKYIYDKIRDLYYLGVISYADISVKNPQPMWIWRKCKIVPVELYNPPVVVTQHVINNIKYNVFRDDYLIGGTKQRALIQFIQKTNKDKYVYAGPSHGYAQIALAFACKIMHKKAVIFINKLEKRTELTEYALSFGSVELHEISADLKTLQEKAAAYSNSDSYLISFGGNEPEYLDALYKALSLTIPKNIKPSRIWIVAGSATILQVLYKIFPKTHFCAVQVGKTIWPDQINNRTTLYVSPEKFMDRAILQPPYPTVATYDAKLWTFFLKYGKANDYIWNVGKDV